MKPRFILSGLIAASALVLPRLSFAQFSPGPNPITTAQTAQRTLSGGTGTINSGGSIVLGGSTVPILLSGNGTILNNAGTIQQTGSGRAIDNNSGSNNSLTIGNTGLISSNSTDAIRINTDAAISLTNSGTIQVTNGGQAIDWAAISTKSNSLTNQGPGSITAVGDDAVRPGVNGVVINAGTISATPTGGASPSGSDGIDLRTLTGIQITNTGTISGRHGIATDGANAGPSTLTVTNNGGLITAVNGSGINVDGPNATVTASVSNAFGATIRGAVTAAATEGDGDGVDVDGVLTVNNSGDILGLGAKGPNNPEALAAGGGSITNFATGQIIGSSLLADAPNGDATKLGSGILIDDSNGGNAIAQTTVTNSGLIRGKTGFGIKIVGTFGDSITNNAGGTIRGAAGGAVIQTGGGGDTVINRGAITSASGNAIDLEAGNDSLTIEGGAASITGNVSGGAGSNTATFHLGTGNTFTYSDALSNFDTVEVKSGTVTLSGANSYAGVTKLTGGLLVLAGANRISATSPLDLDGGNLKIIASGPNGQTFAKLTLEGNSAIDLDPTSLTFNGLDPVSLGDTLAITGYDQSISPDYAFRFLGDLTNNSNFLTLMDETTINGFEPIYQFDGAYTNVSAVPEPSTALFGLILAGALGYRRRKK